MSGRCWCFCVLVLAFCLGVGCACGAEDGANYGAAKKSPAATQTAVKPFSGLEILKCPPAMKEGETISPEAAIRRALETRVRAEFAKAPLDEICDTIEKQLGIPVLLDRRALGDEGLDTDIPMSCSVNDVRLQSYLDLMLSDEDLTWTIHREVLLITTMTASRELLETRVYDVADLAASSESGYTDIDSLVELITTIVSPECWDEVGGEGAIQIIEDNGIRAITISQTLQIHDKIEDLLAALRTHLPKNVDAKGKDAGNGKSEVATEEEAIRQILRKKVDLNFTETPLPDVVEQLKKLLGIKIFLHKRSLADEGLDIETPITFHISGISAAAAMDLMLRDLDLAYMIKDKYLLILTSCAEQELARNTKVYEVADLVGDYEGLDCLVGVIASAIRPESWAEVGGEGAIVPFSNAGMEVLVVNQTQRVQAEVKKFLDDLRKVQRQIDDKQTAPGGMGPRPGGPGMGMPGMGPGMGMGGFRPQGRHPVMAGRPLRVSGRQFTRQRTRKPIPVKVDPARDFLVKDNNQFAFDLYAKLRENNQGKNLFFSPMSISTAMAMTYAGARGKIAEEIVQAMNFRLSQELLHPACRSLLEVSRRGNMHELNIANRLWVQRGHVLLDDYLTITKNYYGAECGLVDLTGDPNEAVKNINNWVSQQTRGRIRDIVGPENINSATRLVLTNAIYFKGQWSDPFEVRNTKPATFYVEGGQRQVEMMSMGDIRCRYAEIEDAGLQILEKPYDEWFSLSMVILLPKRESGSLVRLEADLTEEKLAAWFDQLQSGMVMIYMPKFRMEASYSLRKQLMDLGMRSAFDWDPNVTDFSGMDGTRNLFLQDVLHKAYVDVDERGTEAAAATAIVGGFGGGGAMSLAKPPVFRADHPFVFLIRDNRTGSILFLGRFCGPESDAAASEMPRRGGMF